MPPKPRGELDRLVFAEWTRAGIKPVLCSDAVFVRRVFLDVTGTLPTAAEAREFILDRDTERKRARLIDRLLEREEYADYWAMKWGDILRIKAEFPVNLWPNAAQAYHRWVRAALARNLPYDRFVRELLTSSGSNFRVGPVNFYRAVQNRTPEGIAGAVALTFMGTRIESWPSNRVAGMAAFFSQIGYKPTSEWKEEHVFWNPLGAGALAGHTAPGRAAVAAIGQTSNTLSQTALPAPNPGAPTTALFPDGTPVSLRPDRDPREVFADWLITPHNPWFARCMANRVWAWLLGRGIIHEPDDIRDDNPPRHPALLAHVEREFIAGGYDVKRLFRLILNSTPYQLSSLPQPGAAGTKTDVIRYELRRLEAEVLIDALNQITGTTDLYTSAIPEPYTYIPQDQRAIAIADGSITSPFLALFGRSARATGMDNERDHKPVPAQYLHLLNSSHIQRKLEQGPKLKTLFSSRRQPSAIVEELYLTILARLPTPQELKTLAAYGQTQPATSLPAAQPRKSAPAAKAGKPAPGSKTGRAPAGRAKAAVGKAREDWVDIAWALINSAEFLHRH